MRLQMIGLLAIGFLASQAVAQEPGAPKTQKDKISYSIGVQIGKGFKEQAIDIDVDTLIKGIKDSSAGGKLLMAEDDMRATMMAFETEMRQKHTQAVRTAGEENKKTGDAFLAENKTKKGVTTTPSGLQYEVITAGTGKKPTDTDTVECNYRGTLINGKEFDSSYKRGEPAKFPVSRVIPGWTEALKLMPVGSKWKLYVPPNLGYGPAGAGPDIPPNSTLIFEVELLGIK